MKNKMKKGFTLIELLIVITIIGILAVAFLPSILGAPAKARDVARKGHLNTIATAIEAGALAKGLAYPTTAAGANKTCLNDNFYLDTSTKKVKLSDYIQGGTVPKDPGSLDVDTTGGGCDAGDYAYVQLASPQNYALVAKIEEAASGNATAIPTSGAKFTAAVAKQTYYVLVH